MTGTHSPQFAAFPASGRPVVLPSDGICRFGDDPTRMNSERACRDNDGLMRQMHAQPVCGADPPWHQSK